MVSQGTGWSYHLHLSTGSLQIRQRGLSVGGASCQNGLWPVRGQGVRGSPCDDGLWFAGSQGVVSCRRTIEIGQTANSSIHFLTYLENMVLDLLMLNVMR